MRQSPATATTKSPSKPSTTSTRLSSTSSISSKPLEKPISRLSSNPSVSAKPAEKPTTRRSLTTSQSTPSKVEKTAKQGTTVSPAPVSSSESLHKQTNQLTDTQTNAHKPPSPQPIANSLEIPAQPNPQTNQPPNQPSDQPLRLVDDQLSTGESEESQSDGYSYLREILRLEGGSFVKPFDQTDKPTNQLTNIRIEITRIPIERINRGELKVGEGGERKRRTNI
jgi:hypothetical protein